MELTLNTHPENQALIEVACNDTHSHEFELDDLHHGEWDAKQRAYLLRDPEKFGQSLYQALFPQGSLAWQALSAKPDRILIVAATQLLDSIPWEFTFGPDGYLGLDYPILRGLPKDQRIPTPDMNGIPLHIVAVPSNPLGITQPLDIQGEWLRLREILQKLEYAITLERVYPPTLSQLRRLVANHQGRVVHFMGHGGQSTEGAVLQFEDESGREHNVTAREFVRRIGKTAYAQRLCQRSARDIWHSGRNSIR